jgi:hypothetical protein
MSTDTVDHAKLRLLADPDAPSFGFGRWKYCNYCYKNVRPLTLIEDVFGLTRMAVCSECGAGLTAPEPMKRSVP